MNSPKFRQATKFKNWTKSAKEIQGRAYKTWDKRVQRHRWAAEPLAFSLLQPDPSPSAARRSSSVRRLSKPPIGSEEQQKLIRSPQRRELGQRDHLLLDRAWRRGECRLSAPFPFFRPFFFSISVIFTPCDSIFLPPLLVPVYFFPSMWARRRGARGKWTTTFWIFW